MFTNVGYFCNTQDSSVLWLKVCERWHTGFKEERTVSSSQEQFVKTSNCSPSGKSLINERSEPCKSSTHIDSTVKRTGEMVIGNWYSNFVSTLKAMLTSVTV